MEGCAGGHLIYLHHGLSPVVHICIIISKIFILFIERDSEEEVEEFGSEYLLDEINLNKSDAESINGKFTFFSLFIFSFFNIVLYSVRVSVIKTHLTWKYLFCATFQPLATIIFSIIHIQLVPYKNALYLGRARKKCSSAADCTSFVYFIFSGALILINVFYSF